MLQQPFPALGVVGAGKPGRWTAKRGFGVSSRARSSSLGSWVSANQWRCGVEGEFDDRVVRHAGDREAPGRPIPRCIPPAGRRSAPR